MSRPAYLQLEAVGKSFPGPKGPRVVLKDVSLRVFEGEFVAIVGASGSGKTTLVSLIAGLIQPDAGRVLLEGRPVAEPGPDRGVVFQSHSLLPWLSVYDNVRLAVDACDARGEAERHRRTLESLRMVRLEGALGKRPAQLSGGMRQRVAVARALAGGPRLLLLDEPFSALDALTRGALQQELARLWTEERTTVVMITNDMEEALLLADRVFPLASGPAATLGPEIVVEIERPRFGRRLAREPGYAKALAAIAEFLARRPRPSADVALAAPPLPTLPELIAE
jgi:nitrate/nitrite transport system ATP-binding protein